VRLVLFDIDGTLLHANGLGSAATRLAMTEVFGTVGRLDEFSFGGKTDWQMLQETLRDLIPAAEIERRLPEYDMVLGEHIRALTDDFGVKPCPGAPEVLSRALDAPDVLVGILTANMPRTAHLKLHAAHYNPHDFDFGVYGSEAPTRTGLAPIALQRAREHLHRDLPPENALFIGDTPEDIACARSIGGQVIAVATGRYSADALAAHQPTVTVENLADTDSLWSIISGNGAG
jgi:phosphoglycolate phosphatase-like HAD superfamily hydrolase